MKLRLLILGTAIIIVVAALVLVGWWALQPPAGPAQTPHPPTEPVQAPLSGDVQCSSATITHRILITQADDNTTKTAHMCDVLDFQVAEKQDLIVVTIPADGPAVVKKLSTGVYQVVRHGTAQMFIMHGYDCTLHSPCSNVIATLFQITIIAL